MTGLLRRLLAEQAPDGAFLSYVRDTRGPRPREARPDRNGFVTALVLRSLRRGLAAEVDPRESQALQRGIRQAMDFLEACCDPELAGAFRFWPRGLAPSWAAELPADADDTAVLALELRRRGRLSRGDLRRIVQRVLIPSRRWSRRALRARRRQGTVAPWILDGAMPTWLGEGPKPVIDAAANANVCALYAVAGAKGLEGYTDACAQVASALAWAGGEAPRLAAIAPYYGHAGELSRAVLHAIEAGATELAPLVPGLPPVPRPVEGSEEPPHCCSFGSGVQWHSPAITFARCLSQERSRSAPPLSARNSTSTAKESSWPVQPSPSTI